MFISKAAQELHGKFEENVFKSGVLDRKTKELVAFSISLIIDCIPCIKYHYKAAIEAGSSKEEIADCCAIVMSVNAGSKRAKYSDLINKLENE